MSLVIYSYPKIPQWIFKKKKNWRL